MKCLEVTKAFDVSSDKPITALITCLLILILSQFISAGEFLLTVSLMVQRCLSVVCNVCIVAERYVLLENCLKKQIGLPDRYTVIPFRADVYACIRTSCG